MQAAGARQPSLGGRLKWRLQLVREKVGGRFPSATWLEITRLLLPRRVCGTSLRATVAASDRATGHVLWRTAAGSVWGDDSDRETLELIAAEQLLSIYQQGPVCVRRGDVVLDIGGHLGLFTHTALGAGAALVVVFEPDPRRLSCLEATFATEIARNTVRLVPAGAWHSDGFVVLGPGDVTRDGSHASQDDARIDARRIDTVVAELALERVDFIKMDIEGSERHALAGARGALARWSPRLALCTYHLPDDPEVLRREVFSANPRYCEYVPSYPRDQAYFWSRD